MRCKNCGCEEFEPRELYTHFGNKMKIIVCINCGAIEKEFPSTEEEWPEYE